MTLTPQKTPIIQVMAWITGFQVIKCDLHDVSTGQKVNIQVNSGLTNHGFAELVPITQIQDWYIILSYLYLS